MSKILDHEESEVTTSQYKCIYTNEKLSLDEGVDFVKVPCQEQSGSMPFGAINSFIGIIRDEEVKGPIKGLIYEHYKAPKFVAKIIEEVIESHRVDCKHSPKIYVQLRGGFVPVGEASIIICVSSTGRHQSHNMVMDTLERIKSTAPIWKRIIYSDGTEEWFDESKSMASWLRRQE